MLGSCWHDASISLVQRKNLESLDCFSKEKFRLLPRPVQHGYRRNVSTKRNGPNFEKGCGCREEETKELNKGNRDNQFGTLSWGQA
eukprot:3095214-Amphidinium_carterae.1